MHDKPTCQEIEYEGGVEAHEPEVLELEMYARQRTTRLKMTDMSQRGLIWTATRQTHMGSSMTIHIGYTSTKDSYRTQDEEHEPHQLEYEPKHSGNMNGGFKQARRT